MIPRRFLVVELPLGFPQQHERKAAAEAMELLAFAVGTASKATHLTHIQAAIFSSEHHLGAALESEFDARPR